MRTLRVKTMSDKQIVGNMMMTTEDLVERAKQLINESNDRKLIVRHEDKTLLEIPLTAGVVGAVLSPHLAALAIFSAILTKCTISIEDRY